MSGSLSKASDLLSASRHLRIFMVLSGPASCNVVCNEPAAAAAVPLTESHRFLLRMCMRTCGCHLAGGISQSAGAVMFPFGLQTVAGSPHIRHNLRLYILFMPYLRAVDLKLHQKLMHFDILKLL